jgi:hypothetical protein
MRLLKKSEELRRKGSLLLNSRPVYFAEHRGNDFVLRFTDYNSEI